MPEKLPRKYDASAPSPSLSVPDPQTAFVLGAAHVAHGSVKAAGDVASATVTAAGQVLGATINTLGETVSSLVTFLKEREITNRVIAQELAATQRLQIWSDTVIAEAEEMTERVRISATLVLATINDKAKQRDAKLKIVQECMDTYKSFNTKLIDLLANRAMPMPLEDRELLQQHIATLLHLAQQAQVSITTIAVTL